MTISSVRYSALRQDEPGLERASALTQRADASDGAMQFGTDPDFFKSAFTYANYNDLDKMGYEAPKRYGRYARSSTGRFTFGLRQTWEDEDEPVPELPASGVELVLIALAALLALATLPFSLIFTLRLVAPSERLVVLRLGRALRPRGPGPSFVLPCVDCTHVVDTRLTAFAVPPMQVITQDRGIVELGATVFLQVRNVVAAVCEVQDREGSTRTLASSLFYKLVGRKRVCDLTQPHQRRELAAHLQDELSAFTQSFGTQVTNVELSEVKVIKQAENMGMAALSAVAKSEVGQQIWNVIGPTLEEIAKEARENQGTQATLVDVAEPAAPAEPAPTVDVVRLLAIINLGIDQSITNTVGKVFQIHSAGNESFYLDLKHGDGKAAKGIATHSDVTLHVDPSILPGILKGSVSPLGAYMNGSLRIDGSVQDATLLSHLAQRVAHLL